MNKHEEPRIKSVSIRIPVDVLEELHTVAKNHDRSLNGEVLTAIRNHLKKSQKEQRHQHDEKRTAHTSKEATGQVAQEPTSAV